MWLISPWAIAWSSCVGRVRGLGSGCLGFGIEAREERLGLRQRSGLAGVRSPAKLIEQGRAAVAVRTVRPGIAELGEDPWRRRRHERRDREPDQPARLDEVAEDRPQARRGLGVTRLRRLGE